VGFYQLPIYLTVIILFASASVWTLLKTVYFYRFPEKRKIFYAICIAVFVAWVYFVFDNTVLSREILFREPCWMPFNELKKYLSGEDSEMLRSAWMNVLFFVPGGLFLSEIFRKKKLLSVPILTLFSFIIEMAQFKMSRGFAETDDIITNTLGAVVGLIICIVSDKLRKLYCEKYPKKGTDSEE